MPGGIEGLLRFLVPDRFLFSFYAIHAQSLATGKETVCKAVMMVNYFHHRVGYLNPRG